jgi:hypothetical protein
MAQHQSTLERDLEFYRGETERLRQELRLCLPHREDMVRARMAAVANVAASLDYYATIMAAQGYN